MIYLSGHGGWARFPGGLAPGLPAALEWPFFVTADQPRGYAFASLLAVELSTLVSWCARVTQNIAVITDACFAPELVRGELRLKSTGRHEFAPPPELILGRAGAGAGDPLTWAATLAARPRRACLLDEQVVCVNAAGAEQPAYEVEDDRGRASGAFTDELCGLLEAARARRVCWRQLVALIDQRLANRWGDAFARPEVSGPDSRRVLELDTVDVGASCRYFVGPRGHGWLGCGTLHGVAVSDRFVAHDGVRLVKLEVVEVREDRSRVVTDGGTPEDGGLAHVQRCARQVDVAIEPSCPAPGELKQMLAGALRLRLCAPERTPTLRVTSHPGGLAICSDTSELLLLSDVERLLDDLDALARAWLFEQACARSSSWRPECSIRVVHRGAGFETELREGGRVMLGERLWVELANRCTREVPGLYLNLVERDVDGVLRVLNASHYPGGVPVRAGTTRRLLWYPEGPHGRRQTWAPTVPRDRARVVRWTFVASALPLDLRALTHHGDRGHASRVAGRRAAEATRALGTARVEAVTRGPAPWVRWSCRHLRYVVETPRSA